MRAVVLDDETDFAGWRSATRTLVLAGIIPEQITWSVRQTDDLFADEPMPAASEAQFSVPRAVLELAETVILAREPERFALLYMLVWRAHAGERHILQDSADPLVQRIQRLAAAIRRDIHKMRAFLRFRRVDEPDGERHVAWFEPDHHILHANAPFFVRRFATMRWSILTPEASAHWDLNELTFEAGADPADVPDDDALEAYWRTYFAAIFNPARLKLAAMTSEMPKKYWRNLPEARAIPELIRDAPARVARMEANMPEPRTTHIAPLAAPEPVHAPGTGLESLAQQAASCRRCELWRNATQVVFGEGPRDATMMLVGEQPGDQEDLAGRPFVGPAGQMLDRALQEAGVDRSRVYVTNAVKHFKFEPRGKRRIHAKPDASEIRACNWWLEAEQEQVRPKLVVLLGASAARAVLGRTVAVTRERGHPVTLRNGTTALLTVHPSYLLRLPDEASKQAEYRRFVADLTQAQQMVGAAG